MKLRNKKTGEIGELYYYPDKEYHFAVSAKENASLKKKIEELEKTTKKKEKK